MARKAARGPQEETLSLWKREQARLKALVVDRDTEAWQRDPAFSGLQRVGGVDVSFVKDDSVSACASLVVLNYPELEDQELLPFSHTGMELACLPPLHCQMVNPQW